jgi:hypothetical protein
MVPIYRHPELMDKALGTTKSDLSASEDDSGTVTDGDDHLASNKKSYHALEQGPPSSMIDGPASGLYGAQGTSTQRGSKQTFSKYEINATFSSSGTR